MAQQPIIEKIKVKFYKIVNGEMVSGEAMLQDLTSDDKQSITSLVILPILNKDGSENKQKLGISEYIKDFPMLRTLCYPSQFTNINVKQIQKNNCPYLTTVVRTQNEGHKDDVKPFTINGKIRVTGDVFAPETLKAFANLVGEENKIISIYEFSPVNYSTTKSKRQNHFITASDLENNLSEIDKKIDAISRRLGSTDKKVLTKTQVQNILKNFVGRITDEELNSIIQSINNINLNVDVSHLEDSVQLAIKNGFEKIHSERTKDENDNLNSLIAQIETIRQANDNTENTQKIILKLLRNQMPNLIATNRNFTDKVYMKLGQIDSAINSEDGLKEQLKNVNAYSDLILEELVAFGDRFTSACNNMNLSQESKDFIVQTLNVFARETVSQVQQGDKKFFEEIKDQIQKIPTIEDVQNIANNIVSQISINNIHLNKCMAEIIINNIVGAMGDITRLNDDDLSAIENSLFNVARTDEFKTYVGQLINDNDIAKSQNIDEVKSIIARNHDNVLEYFKSVQQTLSQIPTLEDLERLTGKGIKETRYAKLAILNEVRKQGMKIDDLKSFLKSAEYMDIMKNAFGITELQKKVSQISSSQTEMEASQNQIKTSLDEMTKNLLQTISTNVNLYGLGFGIASGVVAGNGQFIPTYAPYVYMPYQQFSQQPTVTISTQNEMNRAVSDQIQNVFGKIGWQMPTYNPQTPPNNAGELDKIKAEYNTQLENLRKQNEELTKKVAELTEALKGLTQSKPSTTSVTEQPNDPQQQGKKQDAVKQTVEKPIVEKKSIPVPKPDDEKKLVSKSVENLEKLAEPKKPWYKRLGKFIKRHPIISTIVGIGAGALVTAVAVGAVATVIDTLILKGAVAGAQAIGGVIASQSLPITIGAGVGGVLGGIGTIALSRTAGVKKEKLYHKFEKQKKKCDKAYEKLQETKENIQETQQNIENLLNKQRTGNKILKKVGLYKKLRMHQRTKLRKLRAKAHELPDLYIQKAEKALKTKQILNAMESKSNKTMAMIGNLHKLRKVQSEFKNNITNPYLSEDEKKGLIEEYSMDVQDIQENVNTGDITQLGSNFQTFDKEALDIISQAEEAGKKSNMMEDVKNDIQDRNSKTVLNVERVKAYNDQKVEDYRQQVAKNGSEQDKENLKRVEQDYSSRIRELIEKAKDKADMKKNTKMDPEVAKVLIANGKLDLEEVRKINPELAHQFDLMKDSKLNSESTVSKSIDQEKTK